MSCVTPPLNARYSSLLMVQNVSVDIALNAQQFSANGTIANTAQDSVQRMKARHRPALPM